MTGKRLRAECMVSTRLRIFHIVKIQGFVNSASGFTVQPSVIDGASSFIGQIMVGNDRHARSAVGVSKLPSDTLMESEDDRFPDWLMLYSAAFM